MCGIIEVIKNLMRVYQVKGYIVGGYVRDWLLGRPSEDIDIVVEDHVFDVARAVAGKLQGNYVELDRDNQVARVVLHSQSRVLQVDFSAPKGPDLKADLCKRDFTINALALPLNQHAQLLDFVGGRQDIKKGIIRMVSPTAFADDPLRILRAFRLAAQLDFVIEPATIAAMVDAVKKLSQISGERIWQELAQLLACADSAKYVCLADQKIKLWNDIIPQTRHNHWQHNLDTLAYLEEWLLTCCWPKQMFTKITAHFRQPLAGKRSRLVVLKLACLMHQGQTAPSAGAGKLAGVEVLADKLRLSNNEKNVLTLLVNKHTHPVNLFNQSEITPVAVYRLFQSLGPSVYDCLLLSLASTASNALATGNSNKLHHYQQHIYYLFDLAINQPEKFINPTPLVNGYDLTVHLQIKPSPLIGQLLKQIAEAQVEGYINNRVQALAFAQKLLKGK